MNIACGIIYEHVLGDDIQTYKVRAFPTYVLFTGDNEVGRVQGVNFDGIKALVNEHAVQASFGPGEGKSLGGGGSSLSAADARVQRLARFGGGGNGNVPDSVAAAGADTTSADKKEDEVMKDAEEESPTKSTEEDTKMDVDEQTATEKADDDNAEGAEKCEEVEMVDPTEALKKEDIETLTSAMGFSEIRAKKGLLNGNGGTVEGAVEWLLQHQDDDNIDDPIEKVPKKAGEGGGLVAQSYKCNDCGKILSNMANLELHANKTGHSDFEESTEFKKPLTAEEKQAKILEIKSLLKAKRMDRESTEKAENVDREKQRRFMGQEVSKTREQMEIEARKRSAQQRKKEKEAAVRERQRIRAQLEQDKRERAANKGKLSSRLGVDGYTPDAIQYDVPAEGEEVATNDAAAKKPKAAPSVAKMDEYITKVSSYRAGGDGGNCLKILKAYIGNIVKNPDEDKYRKINMENKAYKTKVKPFMGAKSLLLCLGFSPSEDGTALELVEDADMKVLETALSKVEAAYDKYMK